MRKHNILVSGILASLVLASCHKTVTSSSQDPEFLKLEGSRVELEHRVAVARLKVARLDRSQQQDLTPLHALTDLKSRRKELSSLKAGLEASISSIEEETLLAKASQIEGARNAMTGKELPALRTQSGRTYEQVRIVSISDSGVQIRHASGSARLGYDDLDEGQRERFGLDEGLATAAAAAESQQLAAYEQQIDKELADLPTTPETSTPVTDSRPRPYSSYRAPVTSAFDRRVALGSSESVSNQVVARYRTYRRSSSYYYTYTPSYQPCTPTYRAPVSAKAMGVVWPSGAPVYPRTSPSVFTPIPAPTSSATTSP